VPNLPSLGWKAVSDALAAKFAGIAGIAQATSEPDDTPPSSFPFVLVTPPDWDLDEEAPYVDAYDATFTAWIAFSLEGGGLQMLREEYAVMDGLAPAFRTGRRLGLPLLVRNSKILSVADAMVTYWGEPAFPGLEIRVLVQLAETIVPRSD
jgi:hypothetical protein